MNDSTPCHGSSRLSSVAKNHRDWCSLWLNMSQPWLQCCYEPIPKRPKCPKVLVLDVLDACAPQLVAQHVLDVCCIHPLKPDVICLYMPSMTMEKDPCLFLNLKQFRSLSLTRLDYQIWLSLLKHPEQHWLILISLIEIILRYISIQIFTYYRCSKAKCNLGSSCLLLNQAIYIKLLRVYKLPQYVKAQRWESQVIHRGPHNGGVSVLKADPNKIGRW